MIKVYRREYCNICIGNVGGVPLSTDSNFKNQNIDRSIRKYVKSKSGESFEESKRTLPLVGELLVHKL